MYALFALLIASVVALVASACFPVLYVFPLITSILSAVAVSLLLLMKAQKMAGALKKVLFELPATLPALGSKGVDADLLIALTLFLLWAVTAGVCTFEAPFTTTSNGYFACWGAVAASAMHLGSVWRSIAAGSEAPQPASLSAVQAAAHNVKAQIGAMLVCYTVVFIAGLQGTPEEAVGGLQAQIGGLQNGLQGTAQEAMGGLQAQINSLQGAAQEATGGSKPWEAILAIVISSILIALGLVLLVLIDKLQDLHVRILALTMFGCGFLEAFICTFRRPFTATGNGYFGSWLGLVCSIAVCVPLLPDALKNLMNPSVDEPVTLSKVIPA